jgi:hypothetical protein
MASGRDSERIEIERDSLERFKSAALEFARDEAKKISLSVIDQMRAIPPSGVFDDLGARHVWDEYCWAIQEGPYDNEIGCDDVNLGSLSDAFDETLRALLTADLENLPKHTMTFLSALAQDEYFNFNEEYLFGSVYVDAVCEMITNLINERAASRQYLDLIGPNRVDVIGYHIEGSGMVWRVLNDATDLISTYVDQMIDPDADLSQIASDMADQFMATLATADENTALVELLDRFAEDIRTLVLEKDAIPSLEDMRASLLDVLDK